jgi:phage protein D
MSLSPDTVFARSPRIQVQIAGITFDTVMHANLVSAGSCKSSHFELSLALSEKMGSSQWLDSLSGSVVVKIYMRLHQEENDTIMFEGLMDSLTFDSLSNIVSIRGRDYSSILIDSTYQESFYNQTASEVANSIAVRHGLSPNIVETFALIGGYSGGDHSQLLLNAHSRITSEWDLLTHLARIENVQLFVDGTSLVFSPLSTLDSNYISVNKSMTKGIRFTKTLPLSEDSRLTVKSWNSWRGQLSQYTDPQSSQQDTTDGTGLANGPGIGTVVIKPNLSPQGAENLYKRCLNSINERAISVEITMPGEMTIKPCDIISVRGSKTCFDSDYVVRTVRRQYSSTTGFVQIIQGFVSADSSNSSQENVVA